MIYYWNDKYFEGLKQVGEAYISRPDYELFGEYCLKKEQGLKKLANQISIEFVDGLKRKPLAKQREIVAHLCELSNSNSVINHHMLVFIRDIVKNWLDEPNSIKSVQRFYRYCTWDEQERMLAMATDADPNDQFVLTMNISEKLQQLEWMTHHLSENIILGKLETAQKLLSDIETMIPKITEGEEKSQFKTRFDNLQILFHLWKDYISKPKDVAFLDWAKHKDVSFDW